MTRGDLVVIGWVIAALATVIFGSAIAASVADFYDAPRQAHAFHMVSYGTLLGSGVLLIASAFTALGFFVGVIARPRALRLRGGTGLSWVAALRPGSVSRVSSRFIRPARGREFDAFGQRRLMRGRRGEQ